MNLYGSISINRLLIVLYFHIINLKKIIFGGLGVKIISTPKNDTEKWLLSINKELSQKANINVPEFGIFDSKQPNAFATGSSKNNSLVAVSTGLLVTMNKD